MGTDLRQWIALCEAGLTEAAVIDLNPEVTRHLFDLDLAGASGAIPEQARKKFAAFLTQNKSSLIRLYHGTSARHDVLHQGLLPTSAKRRLSLQSGSGYVYLTYDPQRALSFATMGHPGQKEFVVYSVEIPISKLLPDPDQLRNKRMWGRDHVSIGNTLADSLIYGAGARVRGAIEPYRIVVFGKFDRSGQRLAESLSEAFNRPMPYKWLTRRLATFNVEDRLYRVLFTQLDTEPVKNTWYVEFSLQDQGKWKIHKTGTGNAHQIFSTVLAIISEFIVRTKPKQIHLSATSENRKNLYLRLAQRISGYTIATVTKTGDALPTWKIVATKNA